MISVDFTASAQHSVGMHGLRNWHYTANEWAQDVLKAVEEGKPVSERTVALARKQLGISNLPCINLCNILQVIAAVAADNLMRCAIAQTAPMEYRVEIVDGMGHALTQPVYVGSTYAAVQKAGIWYRCFKHGQWAQGQGGSMGDGWGVANFFSRARTWERSQRNSY